VHVFKCGNRIIVLLDKSKLSFEGEIATAFGFSFIPEAWFTRTAKIGPTFASDKNRSENFYLFLSDAKVGPIFAVCVNQA
jgi:hypothetical protein